ncbi:MAG TPA: bifunctional ADP-dependent NAD(P)H-hydrate dehydratase/NAD(P)H-hydrate epimerase, partial [candidate division Zixibacteria bacterium]|nr:bifunctional ADP-dependent NAD(P)H-hydrate dehydratase/NAD(P)H-hydrate epimerase [candidate division Zixibacteria bacterium]
MQSIDRRAIEGMKIPGLTLMENAGTRVLETILENYELAGKFVTVVCGKGNNGGDGFVVARQLHKEGIQVELFLIGEREAGKGDALTNLEHAEKAGLKVVEIADPSAFAISPNSE